MMGVCPFCREGRLVVLLEEDRWLCYGCYVGGSPKRFTEMLEAGVSTRTLGRDEFTLANAGIG